MKTKFTDSFVPNLLTIANLFSGFASIIYAFDGDFKRAAMFIVIGAFFDLFDGVFARLIGVASEFGGQLDSLSDVVTFGVAPSILLYTFHFHEFGEIGIFLSSFPALMGALRLARFNTQLDSLEDKKDFTGLPIPASAMIIVSYIYFFNFFDRYLPIEIIYFLCSFPPLLMVSNIKFINVPRPNIRNIKKRPLYYATFFLIIITIISSKFKLFLPFMILYISWFTIKHIANWIFTKSNDDSDFDEFIFEQIDSK